MDFKFEKTDQIQNTYANQTWSESSINRHNAAENIPDPRYEYGQE